MNAINKFRFLGKVAENAAKAGDYEMLEDVIDWAVDMVVLMVNDGEVERGTEYNQLIEAISDIKLAKKYKEGW